MKFSKFKLFLNLFADQKSILKFGVAVVLGFGFSIAVILSTVGIMDGFEKSLKAGLKKSNGDITINSRKGFFVLDDNFKNILLKNQITKFSRVVQSESFILSDSESKGVLVKGIDELYGDVVGLDIKLTNGGVAIGSDIAKSLGLKIGDEITLAFAKGNTGIDALPSLTRFTVNSIINHGIYQKDSRMVYITIQDIQRVLELTNKINLLVINIETKKGLNPLASDLEKIYKNKIDDLKIELPTEFFLRPYWKEFTSLIEAVKVEKIMITLILQLVVIISIFNILAFIIFVNEKKSKELFLFKALGVSQKVLSNLWLKLIIACWAFSCLSSIVFVELFKVLLKYISIFNLPPEIYFMPRLEMHLTLTDYLIVFGSAFIWVNLITFILLNRIKNKSLLDGLRQEFA